MLKKIITIENVGRFKKSAATPNPELKKANLLYAANGYGKSTLAAILRSYANGNSDEIIGRKSLGASKNPKIIFLDNERQSVFENCAWNISNQLISVFDNSFIEDNVFSGPAPDAENRRALYRIIVGKEGVALAQEEKNLVEASRKLTTSIKETEERLNKICVSIPIKDFINLDSIELIDAKIIDQEQLLKSFSISEQIKNKSKLQILPEFKLSDEISRTLSKTLDDVGDEAEAIIREHIEKHKMQDRGESWVAYGLEHIETNECPFCGRDGLSELSLIGAYRGLVSDGFKSLRSDLDALKNGAVSSSVGSRARDSLAKAHEKNSELLSFWKDQCGFTDTLPPVGPFIDQTRKIEQQFLDLIAIKASSISKPQWSEQIEAEITKKVSELNVGIRQSNELITRLNKAIETKKEKVALENKSLAVNELNRLMAIRNRYSDIGKKECESWIEKTQRKKDTQKQIEIVRQKLDVHTNNVLSAYETRINYYLDLFNAGFLITKTTHSYKGGVASSTYSLKINDIEVSIGDPRTPRDEPSFKNTLSGGDRSTLALSFFLAHVEREPDLANRIVVFDDPFNSQDSFRRLNTIYQISRVGSLCKQLFVFSHDLNFLNSLWDKFKRSELCGLQIDYNSSTGALIKELDVKKAARGRTTQEIDDLRNFTETGFGELRDVIKKMRVVLESHLRIAYPSSFEGDEQLSGMLTKIGKDTENHPAAAKYNDLDLINTYSKTYHHGEKVMQAAELPIDKTELIGFVHKTLKIVNALPG